MLHSPTGNTSYQGYGSAAPHQGVSVRLQGTGKKPGTSLHVLNRLAILEYTKIEEHRIKMKRLGLVSIKKQREDSREGDDIGQEGGIWRNQAECVRQASRTVEKNQNGCCKQVCVAGVSFLQSNC